MKRGQHRDIPTKPIQAAVSPPGYGRKYVPLRPKDYRWWTAATAFFVGALASQATIAKAGATGTATRQEIFQRVEQVI